jgi:hypothetical protein
LSTMTDLFCFSHLFLYCIFIYQNSPNRMLW